MIVKPAWLVFILFSARILGPESFGLYSLAVLIVSVVFIVFELGVDVNTFKSLATTQDREPSLIHRAFMAKSVLSTLCGLMLAGMSFFLDASLGEFIRIAIPFLMAQSMILFVRHLFRAYIRFDLESRSILVERSTTIVLGSLALWLTADAKWYLMAFTAAYGFTVVHDLIQFKRNSGITFARSTPGSVVSYIRTGASIGVYNALGVLFSRVSSIIFYAGGMSTADIGRFNSGNRLFDSFALLPTIITEPLYPRMCKAINNRNELTELVRFPAVFQFAFGTLAAMLAVTHHQALIGFLLGAEYAVASLEIALTFSVLMAFSVTTITSKLIIAAGEERVMSRILVVFTISQIVFLYMASQLWGLMGVVLVYVAHEASYAIVLSGVAFRRLNHWDVVRGYVWVLLSALVSLGLIELIPEVNPLVAITFQTIFFGMMLFATRILRIDHATRLLDVILRRNNE